MASSNCYFSTCIQASQEVSKVVRYSHFFENFPQFFVMHTVKYFSIVNEAEVDVFLEFPFFFYDPKMLAIWSLVSSPFSKYSLYIWNLLVHILLKPSLKGFEHYLASMWNEHNCIIVLTILWHCPCLGLERKLTFSSPVANAEFSKFAGILSAALSQHHLLGFK